MTALRYSALLVKAVTRSLNTFALRHQSDWVCNSDISKDSGTLDFNQLPTESSRLGHEEVKHIMFRKATPNSLAPIRVLGFPGRMFHADSAKHQKSVSSRR